MRLHCVILVTFITLTTRTATPGDNQTPIIGILSQQLRRNDTRHAHSYIAASYVKFVESAGARVVPVLINQSEAEYRAVFSSINGLLLPGGTSSIYCSPYARAAKILFTLALQAYQKGDYFPVWGTCLGFEQLAYFTAEEPVRVKTDTTGVALALNFTHEVNGSRLFKDFPADLMVALETEPLTENSHMWSVPLQTYNSNRKLKEFYKVLSTNSDGRTEFISTWEGYKYPVYGVQWHPEKNPYEWTKPFFKHSSNAVKVSFYFADFFVGEARKNSHRFESEAAARELLIYRHVPVYTGDAQPFELMYYF